MKKNYLTLGIILLTLVANGQISFTEITSTLFPALVDGEAAFADFDNDGDLDLLLSGGGQMDMMTMMPTPTTVLYKNDGIGNFSFSAGLAIDSLNSSSIAIGDIDMDGDMDVFICGRNSSMVYVSKIYVNNGSGSFTLSSNSITGIIQGDAEFGDIDGDLDLDLIVSGYSGSGYTTSLYTNDGSGNFSLVGGTPFSGTNYASVKFLDIEQDNDLDVLISGTNGTTTFTELYLNNGSGTYSLVIGTPFDGSQLGSIDAADVDGDSDIDVIITGYNGTVEFTKLYLNDGFGTYTLSAGSLFTGVASSSAQFSDFDIDGDQDLIISGYNGGTSSRETIIYSNDGAGIFTVVAALPFVGSQQFRNKAADIDGDGDPDLYLSGSSNGSGADVASLYRNNTVALGIIENSLLDNFVVYPNPTSGNFALEFENVQEILSVRILSLSGQLIKTRQFQNAKLIQLEIDQPNGIYILEILDNNERKAVIRLIKE